MAFLFLVAAMPAGVPYQQFVLDAGADVWDVAAADMNADGNAEIFAFCCDEHSEPLKKFVAVYMAAPDGRYPQSPTMRLELAPTLSIFFFAETDGTPPCELVAADAEGAELYKYQEGRFMLAAAPRFPSLLPYFSKEPFFSRNAAADLDGDGIDEWMIPLYSGYELRNLNGPAAFVPCDVLSDITANGSLYITHRLPAIHLFAREGERNKGIAFLSDEFADFAYGEKWRQHTRFRIPVRVDEKWEAGAKIEDIDGNGEPDLIITQTKGTINMKAVTHVYLSRGNFRYPEKPDAEYQVNGALMSPMVRDVNGDKKLDIGLASIPLNVWNIINFFVRRKVNVKVEVYLFADGGFSKKPVYSQDFLLDAPEGRERVAYTFGDFNGDGRLDAVFGAGATKLVVHTGEENRLVSSRPWVTLSLPAFGIADRWKLNANEAEDLIIAHPGGDNKKRIDVVVF